MSRQLAYVDAVKILGGDQSRLLSALDKLVGGLLLGGSIIGVPDILGWFDAKGEFVRLTREAVAGLARWRTGATRHDRSDQLRAAHAVLVLVAFVEEASRLDLPFDLSQLKLDKRAIIGLGGGHETFAKRNRTFVEELLKAEVPMPNPIDMREMFLSALSTFYHDATLRFVELIQGLRIWDTLDEPGRESIISMSSTLPRRAISRYEEFFISLAGEFPGVACWANFTTQAATQREISAVRISLQRIEEFLRSGVGNVTSGAWTAIARSNRAALMRPILETEDVPHRLTFPNLSALYIDPRYRVARCGPDSTISREDWWAKVEVRNDLAEFLVGNLMTPEAVNAPIIILGHQGRESLC